MSGKTLKKVTKRELLKIFQLTNQQKYIDKLAIKFKNKKILGYGTGFLTDIVFDNYDLSKLNIVAFSDKKYSDTENASYHGYKAISPNEIPELNPDVVLIFVYHDSIIKDFFDKNYPELNSIQISIINNSLFYRIKLFLCGY